MTARGLKAEIHYAGRRVGHCYVIGRGVPGIHVPSGDLPVYHVVDHVEGAEILCTDGTRRWLGAYPAAWPGAGSRSGRMIYVKHERLPWNAPVPCFDLEREEDAA